MWMLCERLCDVVTVLRQIHDELDEAVLEAYDWSDLAVSTKEAPHSSGLANADPLKSAKLF